MKQDAKSLGQRDNARRQLLQCPATIKKNGKIAKHAPRCGAHLMRARATLGTTLLDKQTVTDGARMLAGAENGRLGLDCNAAGSRAPSSPSINCGLEGDLLALLVTSAAASPLTRAGDVREDDGRDAARIGEAGEDEERREVVVKRGEGGAV